MTRELGSSEPLTTCLRMLASFVRNLSNLSNFCSCVIQFSGQQFSLESAKWLIITDTTCLHAPREIYLKDNRNEHLNKTRSQPKLRTEPEGNSTSQKMISDSGPSAHRWYQTLFSRRSIHPFSTTYHSQGCRGNASLPHHVLKCFLGDLEDQIPPATYGSATCPEYLPREETWRDPDQILDSPQLVSFTFQTIITTLNSDCLSGL